MGAGQSQYLSEGDLSDQESDSEYFAPKQNVVANPLEQVKMERTDAVLRNSNVSVTRSNLTLESVGLIEDNLDLYEVVSLGYLLFDTPDLALKDLKLALSFNKNDKLLYKWAKSEKTSNNKWDQKLIEALCIIQNYQILKKLGYNKTELRDIYLPHLVYSSININKLRKVCYLIAEDLDSKKTFEFITEMEKQFGPVDIDHRGYLELCLLFWEQNHIDLGQIKSVFKILDWETYYDMLDSCIKSPGVSQNSQSSQHNNEAEKLPPLLVSKKPTKPKQRKISTARDTTAQQPPPSYGSSSSGQSSINNKISDPCYHINPDKPGIVLIINQQDFFTEPDPRFKDLLHNAKDKMKLESRQGSEQDKIRLSGVFSRLGFKIIEKTNLDHQDMIKTIRQEAKSIRDESSFIVCILSHGENGVVYAANSCKVPVDEIQKIMCRRSLWGKPKVLILQSCRGNECQRIDKESSEDDDENDNAIDGPVSVSPTADLLTFYASIPGYAAIRNLKKGSWLIQAFCDEVEQNSEKYHLNDLCIRVQYAVTNKKWKENEKDNIMTPEFHSSFRKFFYLPPPIQVSNHAI